MKINKTEYNKCILNQKNLNKLLIQYLCFPNTIYLFMTETQCTYLNKYKN